MSNNGERNVVWRPNPGPQTEFLACPAREALFGGSVGGGKTDALLMCAASQSDNRNHRALILRRTFPMLRDLIERSHALFIPLGAEFNRQNSQWRFPSGAIIEFGFLDAAEDKYRYLGRQFSFIGWDELTSWPDDSAYIYLLSRLRAVEGSGLRLEVRATCCPGGPGHSWVRSRFNIPNEGGASECRDVATGFRRVFVPARITDNPFLANTDYARQLEALPEASRKSLLLGRWDVFEGAIFSEWDPDTHICDPFPVPNGWKRWRACDDGYAAPACVLWLVHDKDVSDTIYIIKELYASGLTPKALASNVVLLDGGERWGGVIDSSAFADTGMGARGDVMNRLGCRWTPIEKFPGSRLAGLSAIHQRLARRDDGSVGLKVFRGCCPNLVRTLPALTYSTRNPEEIDPSCEDHAVDCLRYALLFKPLEARRVRLGGI
jgi:Terminase large subunit, T4likevirus-type, N-terminal